MTNFPPTATMPQAYLMPLRSSPKVWSLRLPTATTSQTAHRRAFWPQDRAHLCPLPSTASSAISRLFSSTATSTLIHRSKSWTLLHHLLVVCSHIMGWLCPFRCGPLTCCVCLTCHPTSLLGSEAGVAHGCCKCFQYLGWRKSFKGLGASRACTCLPWSGWLLIFESCKRC